MGTTFNTLLAGVLLVTFSACEQPNKEKSREEFRERQRSEQASSDAPHTEKVPENSPIEKTETFEQTRNDVPGSKPLSTAGDKVIAVKDGDTIDLLRNGKTIKVRLYGIDSPEKAQDYGQKAKDFTSQLAFGKTVHLIEHNKDRYGRTVGTIILPDGRNLNEELVRNGYAWHYKEYSKDKNLEILEADARRFKRGLWQDANPTAPWDYRKNKVTAQDKARAKMATAPLPAGATKRTVYICNSSGARVYHLTRDCFNLKRCTAEVLTVSEAVAIREYGKRADKSCSKK
jgi:micrococcal nuclease